MKKLLALLVLCAVPVEAAPPFPVPKLKDAMAASLTDRARIRWVKDVDGKEVSVTISGGIAERLNPNMSSEVQRLPYDLARNRELEKQVRGTRLGSPSRSASSLASDRTLQILAEGPKEFVVVGQWSMPLKAWKKKNGELVQMLEPLFDVQADVFQPMKGPEK